MTRKLYPKIGVVKQQHLATADGHSLYIEQTGNLNGIPVIVLHGGPGAGCNADHRRYFDPAVYHIILFDQRGCGRSRPFGSLENNNTEALVADLEFIRQTLSIDSWVVFGGSWGATLALVYAIKYRAQVKAMILRGVFLATETEMNWLFAQGGVSEFYPEQFAQFSEQIAATDRRSIVDFYQTKFNSDNEIEKTAALIQWSLWEEQLISFDNVCTDNISIKDKHLVLARSRVSLHYLRNNYFLNEGEILANISAIADVPITIVHGRFDMICRVGVAHLLASRLANAQLQIVPHAGHSSFDKGIIDALVQATDSLAQFLGEAS